MLFTNNTPQITHPFSNEILRPYQPCRSFEQSTYGHTNPSLFCVTIGVAALWAKVAKYATESSFFRLILFKHFGRRKLTESLLTEPPLVNTFSISGRSSFKTSAIHL